MITLTHPVFPHKKIDVHNNVFGAYFYTEPLKKVSEKNCIDTLMIPIIILYIFKCNISDCMETSLTWCVGKCSHSKTRWQTDFLTNTPEKGEGQGEGGGVLHVWRLMSCSQRKSEFAFSQLKYRFIKFRVCESESFKCILSLSNFLACVFKKSLCISCSSMNWSQNLNQIAYLEI